ncbi:MAG: TGS domain-containing protein [Chloroflexi bacterium]|nr:MAG: TGS domain-containing protein [Chloroflexota bacterium]
MPTNLPPEALEAEQRYREARTIEEKIARLEEFISAIPKHKGTDKLRADLRRRLSKLRSSAQSRKKVSRQLSPYHIDREGAGQVVVIGPANVGKSALVDALTNAAPEVSPAPYTTWQPTPGMMPVYDIQVQLIDTPPLTREYVEPEFLDLIRRADLVLLMVDLLTDPIEQLEDTVAVLLENRIVPQHLKERYANQDQRRPTFVPLLVLVNKNDDETTDEIYEIFLGLLEDEWPLIPISVATGRNLDRLKQAVFEHLGVIRVYSKAPGKPPDLDVPFVLKKGSTVEEFAGKVHQDFLRNLKAARVWGSVPFDGQMVPRDYVLQDGDVVELRT